MEELLTQIDDLTATLKAEGFNDAVNLMGLIRKQVEKQEEEKAYKEENLVILYRGDPVNADDDEDEDEFASADDLSAWWIK